MPASVCPEVHCGGVAFELRFRVAQRRVLSNQLMHPIWAWLVILRARSRLGSRGRIGKSGIGCLQRRSICLLATRRCCGEHETEKNQDQSGTNSVFHDCSVDRDVWTLVSAAASVRAIERPYCIKNFKGNWWVFLLSQPPTLDQEVDQFLASEACFPQQRHQSAFGKIAIVLWNDRTTAGSFILLYVMAARRMVEHEAVLPEKANDLTRLDGGSFGITCCYTKRETYKNQQ